MLWKRNKTRNWVYGAQKGPRELLGRCLIILLRLKKKLLTSKIKAFRGLCPQISKYFLIVWTPKEIKDLDICLQPTRNCRYLRRLVLSWAYFPPQRFHYHWLKHMHSEYFSCKLSGKYILTTDTD